MHICSTLNASAKAKAAKEHVNPTSLVMRQIYPETVFCYRDSFNFNPTYNTDGLINCLRQPGLLFKRLQKSLLVNINSLIKSCATRTVPAAETKSIGLPANARGVMVFATQPRQLYRDPTTFVHLSGLGTVKTNYRDPILSATYRDWQKPRHRDTVGN
jgi:hypothetical protein